MRFFPLIGDTTLAASVEPRQYQLSIAASALQKGNTLVVMPTAMGKTITAGVVIARKLAIAGGRVLFLAPTKPLASQHALTLAKILEFPPSISEPPVQQVVCLTGEIAPEERQQFFSTAPVICATPQVVENDVLAGKLDLNDFNLIVFDEAHRLVGDYSYAFIARTAQRTSKALLLGLTASPSSDMAKVKEICTNLGATNLEIRDESDDDVAPYVNRVKMDFRFVELSSEVLEIRVGLHEIARDALRELKSIGFFPDTVVNKLSKRELLAARMQMLEVAKTNPAGYRALSLQAKLMTLMHALDLLDSQGLTSLHSFIKVIINDSAGKSKAARELAADFRMVKVLNSIDNLIKSGWQHPKIDALKEELKPCQLGKTAIVFAHFRDTVDTLEKILNEMPGIRATKLIGKGNKGMTQKKQLATVEQFRNGEYNVLICTSVGEEGLDLTSVDLVIFFEAVPSEIRAIQRRGRTGRIKSGKAIVLVTKGTRDEAFLWISRYKERKMKDMLTNLQRNMDLQKQKSIDEF